MLGNYVRSAARTVARHKGFAVINVTGLAVGMACCLLILVYVIDELSYDQSYEHAERIVRIGIETKGGDEVWRGRAPTFYGLADLIAGEIPGIESTARLARARALMSAGDASFMETDMLFATESALETFSIPFLRGNPDTAFDAPFTAVITEEAARAYFGERDPIGQTLTYNRERDFEVTGIVEPMPANSHFHFDVLLNLESTKQWYSREMFESMGAQWIYTYLLLEAPTPTSTLEAQINEMVQRYLPPGVPVQVRVPVHAVSDIHLRSNLAAELEPGSDYRYLQIFGAIAVFILLIAAVNFMNLATARASVRAREVGVRKMLGARRTQLIRQFLSESTVMSLAAVIGALTLAAASMPVFNALSGKEMEWLTVLHPEIIGALLVIALFVGVLSGSYPAFFLSSFRPARVLKGITSRGNASGRLRRGLVIVQFGISIAIVIGTFVVGRQLDFMQESSPGFDREQIVSIRLPGSLDAEDVQSLRDAYIGLPGVQNASAASAAPSEGLNSSRVRADAAAERAELVSRFEVDPHFVETLGLELVAGRNFRSEAVTGEDQSILVNEAAVEFFDIQDPIGRHLTLGEGDVRRQMQIVGVVKDFHLASFREEIKPVFFRLEPDYNRMLVRIDMSSVSGLLKNMENTWNSRVAEWPFEYTFLDDQFDALYESDRRLSLIFGAFSILAVIVACLGLFGLSAYVAERRTREIGVRKVFGASVPRLLMLLTRDFVALVLIAFAISAPLTWWGMQNWLQDFAYRANFGAGLFVTTAALAIGIAVTTTSWQAARAALKNPVDTLRYE